MMKASMETAQEPTLREKIRRVLVEEYADATPEKVETAIDKILQAIDPFERAAASVVARYDRTFADLAK
jgi:hypothetical protein